MPSDLGGTLLEPGSAVQFADRDDLLAQLDRLEQPVPPRGQGRRATHRERFTMLRYVRAVADRGLLPFPLTLRKAGANEDPPDFTLSGPEEWRETFEITDGSTEAYQRQLTQAAREGRGLELPVDIHTSAREAAPLWADILFSAFAAKSRDLQRGRFSVDHLLIYDLTGLGILLPLAHGGEALRRRIVEWTQGESPPHRFRRVSVVRDQALLLDLTGEGRILRGEAPSFQLPVIEARDEEDLKRRLREIDRFCRSHGIRHLKQFGSILGDREDQFREDSDLDLLVEFEPGTRVTLLDMARLEAELSELTGLKVDLRTAGDLSRYFRDEVLAEAVELDAVRG